VITEAKKTMLNTLKNMSVDELNKEIARQVEIANKAREAIRDCRETISGKTAEFCVGDRVTDNNGKTYQIVSRNYYVYHVDKTNYYGKKVKIDGSLSKVVHELYNLPLRKVES
jgi:S-methylmethionine-dependent homocysteine/selenocysteine methylase